MLIDAKKAAERLNLRPNCLAQWRMKGIGPPFHRLGRHIRYDEDELEAYIRASRVATAPAAGAASTEPGA